MIHNDSRPRRVLVILGQGGHTAEILRLVDMLAAHGAPFVYQYLITREDNVSGQRIRIPGAIFWVNRTRYKSYALWQEILRSLLALVQSFFVILAARPHAVITSGPAVAVPVALWARLFGARVIFIECGARVTRLSLTGRLMKRLAHLFFVQWPELLDDYPQAIYAGRLV
ncbi:PssD/Cps14F family polysaccharide biosynthesis glycosyltransferase [Candidatus Amarolinea dominans]|uniref:PssD/Cps14F family polysaccharide biosynthesis glycosyltransferase n=1 Tax=Candidatus Amarolinea dominans TaxID=3140696 RepID=UPI0031347D7F|nr:hypothetical protein [Anaerolineae bacterium]MBK9094124.1 hypothetical protein [Anaerolineae bacterium]